MDKIYVLCFDYVFLMLQVPLRELVSYLTAASALQMSQVVNKCVQAVSQYLSPTLGFLKLERTSEKKEIYQPDSLKNQEETNAAHLSASIQKFVTEEEGGIQLKSRVSQRVKEDSQELREVKDDTEVSIANIKIEGGEMQSFHANKPSYQDTYITSALESQLCPPTPTSGHMSSPVRGISSQHEKSVGNLRNKYEEAAGEQREDEGMFLQAAQRQECEELMESDLYSRANLPKSHSSGDELTEDLDSTLVQRPYLCRRCDRVFQQLESYAGHLKEHRQYFCLVCGKGFSQKSSLTHHIGVHSGFKPFRCPLCHEMFSQKAMLQDHLNLHTGNKPHKCNYCAVHFAHKPGLRRHLKDIHGKSSLQNMLEEAVD